MDVTTLVRFTIGVDNDRTIPFAESPSGQSIEAVLPELVVEPFTASRVEALYALFGRRMTPLVTR